MITIYVHKTQARAELDAPVTSGSVGREVQFQFSDDWAGLTKTAVFETNSYRAVAAVPESGTVEIPADVLAYSGYQLRIGVIGKSADGTTVIPTVYAACDAIKAGASTVPVGTPPTPSQAEQLQEQIDALREHGGGSKVELDTTLTQSGKAADAKAVGDALANISGVTVEPAEDDIPKVFIDGVKPTTKDDVLAEMRYISKTENFHAYLEIKCQGTSSMAYDKKNFTVKMYSDEARETKLKKSFKDWNHNGNKYVLKANWIDHTHARNIVCARLWDEVVSSRPDYDTLPEEMRNSPRNGAIDGFPVKVYYNGTYEGIYTWNIGKDDWMWNMDEENPNHVLLCAETNSGRNTYAEHPCNFRALWNGVHESNWSVEVGTNSEAVKTALNNLIQFVMDNDGDAFRNGVENHLDVQSAIDYYIMQYVICGTDGLAKNMLLATYDGTKWICGAYDMDAVFGLWWNGVSFAAVPTYRCPEDYQEPNSLLWERIEANFAERLKSRYAELRETVLSYPNMVTHFERFMDVIGKDLYEEDLVPYPAIPLADTNNIQQIRDYIRDRLIFTDSEFAAMGDTTDVPDEPENPDVTDITVVDGVLIIPGTAEVTATQDGNVLSIH